VPDVLGSGWATPSTVDSAGDVAGAAGAEKVRESILLVLGTRRGERVMRPDFGAGLEDFLFEPVGATTAALVRHRVETALVTWEPRIDVGSVTVSVADRRRGLMHIEIGYRIRATNVFYNLVYPWYLTEGRP
jgi:uncharacterized protein